MSEFVKKTMMGYKEVSGGASAPDCTHVILTAKEYAQLIQMRAQAEWATYVLWTNSLFVEN